MTPGVPSDNITESPREQLIKSEIRSKKKEIKPIQKPNIQELIKSAPIQNKQQDVKKLMTSNPTQIGKFLSKPQGMRALAMFMRPDAAVLLNQRADQKEKQELAKNLLKRKQQFKPEYVKGVGIFDPNTKQVIPGTSPQDLGAPSLEPKDQFNQETKLRDKFNALTKDFRQIRDSYTRVEESGKDPSAAGDMALIFNYMKILDPGSVVREGEFATAQNSAGVPDRTRNIYNRILEGKRLAPDQRNDFIDRANRLYQGRLTQYDQTSNEYKKLAKSYNLDPSRVVLKLTIPKTEKPQTGEDQQAFNWAKANPDDPRSRQILDMLGKK